MTYAEIAKKIDKSEKNSEIVWFDDLCREFDLTEEGIELDRMKAYWILNYHQHGDWCGMKMYFFDSEPVCVSIKVNRKDEEKFSWFSQENANKVENYLLSLIEKKKPYVEIVDIQQNIGNSFKNDYNSEVIDWSKARYRNEPIEFLERVKEDPDYGVDHIIKAKISNGNIVELDIRKDVAFLFNTIE